MVFFGWREGWRSFAFRGWEVTEGWAGWRHLQFVEHHMHHRYCRNLMPFSHFNAFLLEAGVKSKAESHLQDLDLGRGVGDHTENWTPLMVGRPNHPRSLEGLFFWQIKLFHVLWIRYWCDAQKIPMIPRLGCKPKSVDPWITFLIVLRRFLCVNWIFRVHHAYPGILTITAPTHLFFSLPF